MKEAPITRSFSYYPDKGSFHVVALGESKINLIVVSKHEEAISPKSIHAEELYEFPSGMAYLKRVLKRPHLPT